MSISPSNSLTIGVVLALTIVLAGAAPATAQSEPAWADDTYDEFVGMVDRYNANIGDVRAEMSDADRRQFDYLTGKRANVYVYESTTSGPTAVFSMRVTEAGRIVDVRPEPRDDAQIGLHMTRATADEITASDDPANAILDAAAVGEFVGSGDDRTVRGVAVTGETLWESIKLSVIEFVRGLLG